MKCTVCKKHEKSAESETVENRKRLNRVLKALRAAGFSLSDNGKGKDGFFTYLMENGPCSVFVRVKRARIVEKIRPGSENEICLDPCYDLLKETAATAVAEALSS